MRRFGAVLALLVAAIPVVAQAAPVQARLNPTGLQFVQDQVPNLVPKVIYPSPMTMNMYSCGGGDYATFTQQNTTVNLSLDHFALSLPAPGILRIDVTLSVEAWGEAYLDKLYACFGNETCSDYLNVTGAHAIVDFSARIDGEGKAHVQLSNVSLQLDKNNIDVVVSNCPEGPIVTALIGVAKDYGLKLALSLVSNMAQQTVGPKLEQIFQQFMTFKMNAGIVDVSARFTNLDFMTTGISLGADVDLISRFPAAACLPSDPGEPQTFAGPQIDLSQGAPADVGISVNLGLVEDALYHVWHEGYLCVTPDTLHSFGIDLSQQLAIIGQLLPGFPQGTKFSAEVKVAEPPHVDGNSAEDAQLTFHVNKVGADLIAELPDASFKRLHLDLDVTATAEVMVDPGINALTMRVDSVHIDRMLVNDQFGLAEMGFDFARVRQLLETALLPQILKKVGSIPVTGPVFGGMQDVYVILKGFKTTPAYLAVRANLFHAPANDHDAPSTMFASKPTAVMNPAGTKVVLSGSDRQDPAELLKYQVTIDGTVTPPTFVRSFNVGTDGVTKTYHVVAKAIDLAGNMDPVGAAADIKVDGVLPTLTVPSPLRQTVDSVSPSLTWSASDDVSPVGKITARIQVVKLPLHGGDGPETQVEDRQLGAGATTTKLEGLEPGNQYRAVLTVKDEAGNEAANTMLFFVSGDAGGGGCSVGGHGGAGGFASLLLVGLAFVAARRRRVD